MLLAEVWNICILNRCSWRKVGTDTHRNKFKKERKDRLTCSRELVNLFLKERADVSMSSTSSASPLCLSLFKNLGFIEDIISIFLLEDWTVLQSSSVLHVNQFLSVWNKLRCSCLSVKAPSAIFESKYFSLCFVLSFLSSSSVWKMFHVSTSLKVCAPFLFSSVLVGIAWVQWRRNQWTVWVRAFSRICPTL